MKTLFVGLFLFVVMVTSALASIAPCAATSFKDESSVGFGNPPEFGNYGGDRIHSRMVWEIGCVAGENNATFQLNSDGKYAQSITISHLDGIADDSFSLYIKNGANWVLLGHYTDQGSTETWYTDSYNIPSGYSGVLTFRIQATDGAWGLCSTYGQLAVRQGDLYCGNEVPEFGTVASLIALAGAVTAFFIVRKH